MTSWRSAELARSYSAGSETPPEPGACEWCRGVDEHTDRCPYLAYLRGERQHPALKGRAA